MRFFGAGDLRYVILQLISEKPSYGYEIIKSIQERLGGMYAPSPGVVYPMLTMLEEMGHADRGFRGSAEALHDYGRGIEGAGGEQDDRGCAVCQDGSDAQ